MNLEQKKRWLELPDVLAPSPNDKAVLIQLSISPEFVNKNAYIKRRTPIFQLWTHVIGEQPPINNISREFIKDPPTLMTLGSATALFMGVKRPYHDDDDGKEVGVYVLKPTRTLRYEPDMACVARACNAR